MLLLGPSISQTVLVVMSNKPLDDIPDLIFSPKARRSDHKPHEPVAFDWNIPFAAVPGIEELGAPAATSFPVGIAVSSKQKHVDEGLQAEAKASAIEIQTALLPVRSEGILTERILLVEEGTDACPIEESSDGSYHSEPEIEQRVDLEPMFVSTRNQLIAEAQRGPRKQRTRKRQWYNYKMADYKTRFDNIEAQIVDRQVADDEDEGKDEKPAHQQTEDRKTVLKKEISKLSERIGQHQASLVAQTWSAGAPLGDFVGFAPPPPTFTPWDVSDPVGSDLRHSVSEAKRTIANLQSLVAHEASHTQRLEKEIFKMEKTIHEVKTATSVSDEIQTGPQYTAKELSELRSELTYAKRQIGLLERTLADEKRTGEKLAAYLKDVRGDIRSMKQNAFFRQMNGHQCGREGYCNCMRESEWKERLRRAQQEQWDLIVKQRAAMINN